MCSVTLPIFCCTAYPSLCCPYTWWEGDSSSTMQRKQRTGVADIPPAVWLGVKRCCLARNEQWPPSRASGFLPTAAGVVQPLLRTGMEICTELRGFFSINLADQATGKSSRSSHKGLTPLTRPVSWSTACSPAPLTCTDSEHSVAIEPAFSKSDKNTQTSSFSVGMNLLSAGDVCCTTNNCRKAWSQLPSHTI